MRLSGNISLDSGSSNYPGKAARPGQGNILFHDQLTDTEVISARVTLTTF